VKRTIQQKGKSRDVYEPCPQLKSIQRVLKDRFFGRMSPSFSAHGFIRKRSPITNAQAHLRRRRAWTPRREIQSILCVDVKKFFPSIRTADTTRVVSNILVKIFGVRPGRASTHGILLDLIVSLVLMGKELPTGAPTSPFISNLVMSKFDSMMVLYCRRWSLVYTRYADDITVSGKNAHKAYRKIKSLLWSMHKLELNGLKTRVMRRHRAQVITGVTVNSGRATVSQRKRRRLRAAIHHTQLDQLGLELKPPLDLLGLAPLRPEKRSHLMGVANWFRQVSDSSTHRQLHEQASELTPEPSSTGVA